MSCHAECTEVHTREKEVSENAPIASLSRFPIGTLYSFLLKQLFRKLLAASKVLSEAIFKASSMVI